MWPVTISWFSTTLNFRVAETVTGCASARTNKVKTVKNLMAIVPYKFFAADLSRITVSIKLGRLARTKSEIALTYLRNVAIYKVFSLLKNYIIEVID
jgi:hypothetical protein